MPISQLGARPKLKLTPKTAPEIRELAAFVGGTKLHPDKLAAIARNAESRAAPLEAFYIVWARSVGKPKRRHATIEAAQAEAARLRELNPDTEYLVYACTMVQS